MSTFLDWFNQHHSEYQAILFDIDGTLTIGPKPLPGNSDTIQRLRELNFPFFFLTNDGISSHARKLRQLQQGGIDATEDEIVSCADAFVQVAHDCGLIGKTVCMLGQQSRGQLDYLIQAKTIPVTPDDIDKAEAVFIGEGQFDWYTDIHRVINYVRLHPTMPFFCANPDSFWSSIPEGYGIGAGGIARFIMDILKAMGATPPITFLGKPNPAIYLATIDRLKARFNLTDVDNSKLIMVGDALFSDICGANRLGMTSALVMTGVTTPQILQDATGDNVPDLVFDSIG